MSDEYTQIKKKTGMPAEKESFSAGIPVFGENNSYTLIIIHSPLSTLHS